MHRFKSCTLPWQWRLPLVVSGGGAWRSSASVGVATDMLTDGCAGRIISHKGVRSSMSSTLHCAWLSARRLSIQTMVQCVAMST